ncbi:MAG TPA: BamA/TamA family outer membrane protein [Ignavibacteriales bacterium]|nr:BamA/TamA family outer membrane protein [Ignavibacteriales bacterium]
MRIFTKTCFILSLLASNITLAQTIAEIKITGAKAFEPSQYLEWSRVKTGAKVFPALSDSIKSRLTKELILRGFYSSAVSAEIIPVDTLSAVLSIAVIENEPVYINKIFLSYKDSSNISGLPGREFLENKIFNQYEVEEAVSKYLIAQENSGYPFTKASISHVRFFYDSLKSRQAADIHIYMDNGAKSKIDRIEITGNDKTNDRVIARALGIKIGDDYNQEKIEEIPDNLNRLKFFEPVEAPEYYFSSDSKGTLRINIKEKNTNNFDGIAGYIPQTSGGEKGYVTGKVDVSLRNLFGTGRAFAVNWAKTTRYSQELTLQYLEPWIFNLPFNIKGALFQRQQDTSYVRRNLEASIEYMATENISASFIYSSENIIPTENDYSIFTVYNSSSSIFGVSLEYDSRDDYYAPRDGAYFRIANYFQQKKINGPAKYLTPDLDLDITLKRYELDMLSFFEFIAGQVFSLGAHARVLSGDFLEASDYYRLGGFADLRGYREDQFLGNRVFWSNTEYRVLLSPRTYAFTFFDMGYYVRSGNKALSIPELSDFKYGYGIGINLETGFGILGVNFALGEGDSFGEGKIHFGLINEF